MQDNLELSRQNWVFDQLCRGIITHSVHFLRTYLALDYVDDRIGTAVDRLVVRKFEGGIEIQRTVWARYRDQFFVQEDALLPNGSPHTRQQ